MKKIMLCAAVIVAAMAMTGCKKVCKCTASLMGKVVEEKEFDLRNQNVYNSCSELQKDMNKWSAFDDDELVKYNCK